MQIQRLPVFDTDHVTVLREIYVLIENNKVVQVCNALDDLDNATTVFSLGLGGTP